jgi:hypothetical protein
LLPSIVVFATALPLEDALLSRRPLLARGWLDRHSIATIIPIEVTDILRLLPLILRLLPLLITTGTVIPIFTFTTTTVPAVRLRLAAISLWLAWLVIIDRIVTNRSFRKTFYLLLLPLLLLLLSSLSGYRRILLFVRHHLHDAPPIPHFWRRDLRRHSVACRLLPVTPLLFGLRCLDWLYS